MNITLLIGQILVGSLPETNIASENLPLEKEIPIGRGPFLEANC